MDKKVLDALKSLEKNVAKIQADMVSVKADMVSVKADMVTKKYADKFATKDDLKQLKKEVFEKIDDTEVAIIARVDRFKADKDQLTDIVHRVERVEQKLSD